MYKIVTDSTTAPTMPITEALEMFRIVSGGQLATKRKVFANNGLVVAAYGVATFVPDDAVLAAGAAAGQRLGLNPPCNESRFALNCNALEGAAGDEHKMKAMGIDWGTFFKDAVLFFFQHFSGL